MKTHTKLILFKRHKKNGDIYIISNVEPLKLILITMLKVPLHHHWYGLMDSLCFFPIIIYRQSMVIFQKDIIIYSI